MSRLHNSCTYTPSHLPATVNAGLHANPAHIDQLVATEYPFPLVELEVIAQQVHKAYLAERKAAGKLDPAKPSHQPWPKLSEFHRNRNREAVRSIPDKLRLAGLWFRKVTGTAVGAYPLKGTDRKALIERLAVNEHDRWVADQRRQGYIFASVPKPDDVLRLHPCIQPWADLHKPIKDQDRDSIRNIPRILAAAGYEIVKL
jgi:hypothetical protein